MMQRQTAVKVRIWDIVNGTWIKKEGLEPSLVKTPSGEEVSRARVFATVVDTFESENGEFGSITLDDGTDTIRAKAFRDLTPIKGRTVGDLVDVIGKVREYNGEIYIMPEIIRKISDPNEETMRRLELLRKKGSRKEKKPATSLAFFKKATDEEKTDSLRNQIMKIMEKKEDGISYSKLSEALKGKATEEQIEEAINELLSEGTCYEPTPGKIKKI